MSDDIYSTSLPLDLFSHNITASTHYKCRVTIMPPIPLGPIVPTTGANDDAVGASNYPLRGGKHNAYEGGVRATAFVWDARGVLHAKPKPNAVHVPLVHERLHGPHAPADKRDASADKDDALPPLPPSSIQLHFAGLTHASDWLPTICAASVAGCEHLLPPPLPPSTVNPKYGLALDGKDFSDALMRNRWWAWGMDA